MLLDRDRRVDRGQQGARRARRALHGRADRRGARRWNDANVLVLSLRLTSLEVAREMLDAWFATLPDESGASTIAKVEVE